MVIEQWLFLNPPPLTHAVGCKYAIGSNPTAQAGGAREQDAVGFLLP
jgi:hypothetical protein